MVGRQPHPFSPPALFFGNVLLEPFVVYQKHCAGYKIQQAGVGIRRSKGQNQYSGIVCIEMAQPPVSHSRRQGVWTWHRGWKGQEEWCIVFFSLYRFLLYVKTFNSGEPVLLQAVHICSVPTDLKFPQYLWWIKARLSIYCCNWTKQLWLWLCSAANGSNLIFLRSLCSNTRRYHFLLRALLFEKSFLRLFPVVSVSRIFLSLWGGRGAGGTIRSVSSQWWCIHDCDSEIQKNLHVCVCVCSCVCVCVC